VAAVLYEQPILQPELQCPKPPTQPTYQPTVHHPYLPISRNGVCSQHDWIVPCPLSNSGVSHPACHVHGIGMGSPGEEGNRAQPGLTGAMEVDVISLARGRRLGPAEAHYQ